MQVRGISMSWRSRVPSPAPERSRRSGIPVTLWWSRLGLGLTLASGAWAQPQEIELTQAIDFAVRQNRDLKTLTLSLHSTRLDLSDADAAFGWTVQPEGGLQKSDEGTTASYGLTTSRKTIMGTTVQVGGQVQQQQTSAGVPDWRRDVISVEVQQPLFRNVGVLINREPITEAESRVAAARREIELRKTDLVVDVVDTYEELLRLQRQLDNEQAAVSRLERFYRLSQARARQGRTSRVDALRAEVKLGSAQLRVTATQQQLQSRRADFAELLGFAPEAEFLAVAGPRIAVAIPPLESAVAAAFQNRLDYAQIVQDYADVRRGGLIARRNLWPDLQLISRYQRAGEGSAASEALHLDDDTWFVGLGLQSDLPMRKEHNAVQRAEVNEQVGQLKMDALQSAIRRQVQQEILAYSRAQAEIALAVRNYEAAETRMRLTRRLFELGKGDSFSVADAEDEFRQVEADWLGAQTAVTVAACRLMRVLGTLIEYPADLKPKPAT
jgi:outer membrane protein TolC